MIRRAKGEKGFALVLTLVITALMVAVTTDLVHQAYVDISLSRGFRDGQQASLLAESGVSGGIKLLQMALSDPKDMLSLSSLLTKSRIMEDETGTIEISIIDESGKININSLVTDRGEFEPNAQLYLKRLGARLQISENAWNSLADWLDTDDQTRSGGAETSYYASLKIPYKTRNGKMANIAELTLVRGFNPEIVRKLHPFIYAGQLASSVININTAPKEVISALDESIDDRMADRIIDYRGLKPFENTSDISSVPGLETIGQRLQGKISIKGTFFRIISLARVKESARTVDAVWQSGPTQDFLSWQEY